MNRKNKLFVWFFPILLVICTILSSCTIRVTDTKKYLDFGSEPIELNRVFPETLANVKNVNNYSYTKYSGYSYLDIEIILDVIYSDKKFKQELDRINNYQLFDDSPGLCVELIRDQNKVLFNYDTYVATYHWRNEYLYICIDYAKNRMIYIYLFDIPIEKISFDKSLLPKNYERNFNQDTSDGYYYDIGLLKKFMVWPE